ncbi:MAG: glycosyltransferase family 4 protein [Steroidobacteraceae bacterium]
MRILIISQYFHPESFRVNQLATALKERGHEVVVLTGQPNYPSGRFFLGYRFVGPLSERYEGMNVIRVPLIPRGRGRSWQLALNYISFVFFATLFGLPRLRGRFDACIAFSPSPIMNAAPAIVYRFFCKTPVALWLQDLWPETFFAITKSRNRFLQVLLSVLVRWTYRHVDQIWMQTPGFSESVRAHGGHDVTTAYVPNWAEDLYDCDQWDAIVADALPPNSLVFAGNLGRAQGLETLIETADLARFTTPAPHWIIVGEGSVREWLADQIRVRGLGAHITLLPRRPAQEMPRILKAAAAVLVTSDDDPVFSLTVPSRIQSALASGRPIIAALSGNAARVIADARCGLLCPPRDAKGLAQIVKSLIEMPQDERETLGRSGHAYYKANFTQSRVVRQIEDLLGRLRLK